MASSGRGARRALVLSWAAVLSSALTCERRHESPALPRDDGNYSLGSPAADWGDRFVPGRFASSEALDFSGARLDAPVAAFASRTSLHRVNGSKAWPRRRRALAEAATKAEQGLTPLFMGIGTHYAHVYVGTPAQRVSVIVDTGSHHTAFPCSGCKSCGKHTDPYFAARNDGSWFRPNRARNAHRTLIPSSSW